MAGDDKAEKTGGPVFEISVSRLPKSGMPIRFSASRAECDGLARRLGIPAVRRLDADVRVEGWRGEGVRIAGTYLAEVVQACVVTLDPVPETIEEEIDLVFVPEQSKLARLPAPKDGELHLDPEGDDIPETFSGDRLDVGEVLSELVALALDPYPRAPGTSFDVFDTDPDPTAGKVSPFASLGKLKGED